MTGTAPVFFCFETSLAKGGLSAMILGPHAGHNTIDRPRFKYHVASLPDCFNAPAISGEFGSEINRNYALAALPAVKAHLPDRDVLPLDNKQSMPLAS